LLTSGVFNNAQSSLNHLIISLTFITGVFAVFLLGEHSGDQNKTTHWKHY